MACAELIEAAVVLVASLLSLHIAHATFRASFLPVPRASERAFAWPHTATVVSSRARDAEMAQTRGHDYFHFVHITDLHVRKFASHGHNHTVGHASFVRFLRSVLPVIEPEFVVATGDLVDAKDEERVKSAHYVQEWKAYHEALEASGALARNNGSFWWDIRGNHDCFNVCGWDSPNNHFSTYSATRSPGFAFEYRAAPKAEPFLFVGIDACPRCGLARPFNFFGIIDAADLAHLDRALRTHAATRRESADKARSVFAFSHYPLSFTMTAATSDGGPDGGERRAAGDLFSHVATLMCGHLHKFRGRTLSTMYARRATGVLELELGDLKTHGMFRIVVVDAQSGVAVFGDFSLHEHLHAGKSNVPPSFNGHNNLPLPRYAQVSAELVHTPMAIVLQPRDARYAINVAKAAKTDDAKSKNKKKRLAQEVYDGREVEIVAFHRETKQPASDLSVTLALDGAQPFGNATYSGRRVWRGRLPAGLPNGEHELLATVHDHRTGSAGRAVSRFVIGPGGKALRHAVLPVNGGIGETIISQDFVALAYVMLVAGVIVLQAALLLPKLATSFGSTRRRLAYARYVSMTCERLRKLDAASTCAEHTAESVSSSTAQVDRRGIVRDGVAELARRGTACALRIVAMQVSDMEYFLRVMTLRLCELSRLRPIWYPFHVALHVFLHAPMLVGRLVGSGERQTVRLYVYGMVVNDMAGSSGGGSKQFVPLGDAWFLAFTHVWTLFVPLLVFISFNCVPPRWTYGGCNPRRLRPLHVRPGVLAVAAMAVCHHLYNYAMLGVFYDWELVVCSPLGWIQLVLLFALVQSVSHGKRLLGRDVPTCDEPERGCSAKPSAGHVAATQEYAGIAQEPRAVIPDQRDHRTKRRMNRELASDKAR